jgi:NADH-quinone oxidoreductase subunit H
MVKMFTKEDITPANADRVPYNIAPGLSVIAAIMVFAVIPFAPGFIGSNLNVGVLYFVAIGGFGTLAILMGGWASNNKYALLGAFRVVAMLLTYEIPMVAALIVVAIAAGSMSMVDIIQAQSNGFWYIFSMPVVFLIFLLAGIAETGRSPFDLIEAESELIAGFHTEYSGIKFGMFMIGEYVHMFALCFICAVLFLGGWQPLPIIDVLAWLPGPLAALVGFISLVGKVFSMVFVLMWFRGTLPRFRIDHLLDFGWKFLVPLSLALMVAVAIVVRLFAPASSAGVPVEPGPLSVLGPYGEAIALLIVNVAITGLALAIVTSAARRSHDKGLRAVTAVEPVPASGK